MVRLRQLIVLMLAISLPGLMAQAEVRAGIDRANVEQNESFRLTIISDSDTEAEPDVSVLEQYFEVGPPDTRIEARIFNGEMHRSKTWSYMLMPRQAGQLVIPAITVGTEKTTPLIVTVNAVSVAVPGEADAFVTSEVDYDETYVQAQILLSVKIFYAVQTRQPTLRNPSLTGAETLVESAGDERRYVAEINDRRYQVIERVIALYPQESGEIEISPARFEARLLRDGRISGRKTFDSEPLTVTVLPALAPPADYPNATWLPAHDLQVTEEWSRDEGEIKVGEPLTRHITISALGQLETQIPALAEPAAEGLNVYPDKPDLARSIEERGIRGVRRDQYALIGTRGGAVELPTVEIPWWNLETGEWQVATLPSRTVSFEALPEPEVTTPVADASVAGNDTDAIGAPAEAESPFWRRVAEFLAALWVATLIFWWWTSRPVKAPREPAPVPIHKQQAKALRWATKAAQSGDAASARARVLDWARLEWPDNPPLSIGAVAARVNEPLAGELHELSRLSYGPADASWSGDNLVKALKSFSTVEAESSRSAAPLPPLTPGISR